MRFASCYKYTVRYDGFVRHIHLWMCFCLNAMNVYSFSLCILPGLHECHANPVGLAAATEYVSGDSHETCCVIPPIL